MTAPLLVLWDHSHLWGLLACRGLRALGAPYRTVSADAVAHGALTRQRPPALIVPGGFARRKFAALGPAGAAAVREYVAGGGNYFGICGGAGLALSHADGLGLCPWVRRPFSDRLDHLVSGHVRLRADAASPLFPGHLPAELAAPVWWPAGFVPPQSPPDSPVAVLAAYDGPEEDLLLADIPLGGLTETVLDACRERFGLSLTPAFLEGGACVITGRFGQGRYVLSHAHLETPNSPAANAWFAHLLASLSGANGLGHDVPPWEPHAEPTRFADPALETARDDLGRLVAAGIAQRLLFHRNSWLLGWRPGMPGFPLSNLAAMLAFAAGTPATPPALDYWHDIGPDFARRFAAFARRLETFFPAQRLEITLSLVSTPPAADPNLAAECHELFGNTPGGGGQCAALTTLLDGLVARLLP